MRKFVLISQQGSGTNLLRSFLNSHPDILVYDELFCRPNPNHDWEVYTKEKGSIKDFLDKKFDVKKQAVGFDLKYNHINPEVIEYTKEFLVLHFHRDPARTFFQPIINNDRFFNLYEVEKHCEYVKDRKKFVEDNWENIEDLYYEDMTRGKEITSLPTEFEMLLLQTLRVPLLMEALSLSNIHIHKELKKRF